MPTHNLYTRADALADLLDSYAAVGLELPSADLVCAFHEAGHAWAYRQIGRRIRYVTLRPRQVGERPRLGLTMPYPGRSRIQSRSHVNGARITLVALAGPVAEAAYVELAAGDFFPRPPFDELVDHAFDLGGGGLGGDRDVVPERMRSPESVEALREWLLRSWPAMERVAHRLVEDRTLTGSQVFELLGGFDLRDLGGGR